MKKLKSKAFFIYSVLFHILLSCVVVLVSWQIFEPNAYTFMVQKFTARQTAPDDVVVIVIDDKSTARYRWPWKRELYGNIFEYLHNYASPKLIGYDAIIKTLDKEDPKSDENFFKTIKPIDNLVVGFVLLQEKFSDEKQGEIYTKNFNDKFKVKIIDKRKTAYPSRYRSISMYPQEYFNSVKYAGSVNSTRWDSNGNLMLADQITSLNNHFYPSLALRMYMLLNGSNTLTLSDNYITVNDTGLKIPTIQTTNGIHSYIRFYKIRKQTSYSHKKYSAIDIIDSLESIKNGKKPIINPEEFKDKIVFIGANAKASGVKVIDELPTPMLQEHPGVDVQATNLNNLLNNQIMKLTSFGQDVFIIVFLSILTFIIISRMSFFKSITILAVMVFAYLGFAAICYRYNFAVNVVTPLAIQLITMIFAYSYSFIMEGKNKEKIKQAMGKYLSQDIMKNVVKNIDDIKLGGKRANVTVLFADIRGFTSMSEKMTAEEVSVILNEYFTEIEPIITKYNGVINKFIGDAVMAIFGEPIQDINHPVNAVKCAYEMLKKVEQLQDKWITEGKPKIEIGIGINTGDAFVGNIGSEKRLEYTVIGDTVNLASRIESYNKVYRTNFLISSSTYSYVSTIADVIKISEVSIRGKAKKMNIYEVLRINLL